MIKVEKNQIISSRWAKRISAAADKSIRSKGFNGINIQYNSNGLSIVDKKTNRLFREPATYAWATNITDDNMEFGQCVTVTYPNQLQDADNNNPNVIEHEGQPYRREHQWLAKRELEIRECHFSGFGRVGILAEPIKAGRSGLIIIKGVAFTYLTAESPVTSQYYYTRPIADRAYSREGELYPNLGTRGEFEVLWRQLPEDTDDILPAIVRLESRRCSPIPVMEVYDRDEMFDCEVLKFDDNIRLSYYKNRKGDLLIEMVNKLNQERIIDEVVKLDASIMCYDSQNIIYEANQFRLGVGFKIQEIQSGMVYIYFDGV